jgi:purine-cytosine permease-like protein
MTEHLAFRRRLGYDMSVWDAPSLLPAGVAAFVSWACGLTAAFMGADQSWLVGPIAKSIGGADIGFELVSTVQVMQKRRIFANIYSRQLV